MIDDIASNYYISWFNTVMPLDAYCKQKLAVPEKKLIKK
jgi:hypothetical protein